MENETSEPSISTIKFSQSVSDYNIKHFMVEPLALAFQKPSKILHLLLGQDIEVNPHPQISRLG